jgi:hypothetical protein
VGKQSNTDSLVATPVHSERNSPLNSGNSSPSRNQEVMNGYQNSKPMESKISPKDQFNQIVDQLDQKTKEAYHSMLKFLYENVTSASNPPKDIDLKRFNLLVLNYFKDPIPVDSLNSVINFNNFQILEEANILSSEQIIQSILMVKFSSSNEDQAVAQEVEKFLSYFRTNYLSDELLCILLEHVNVYDFMSRRKGHLAKGAGEYYLNWIYELIAPVEMKDFDLEGFLATKCRSMMHKLVPLVLQSASENGGKILKVVYEYAPNEFSKTLQTFDLETIGKVQELCGIADEPSNMSNIDDQNQTALDSNTINNHSTVYQYDDNNVLDESMPIGFDGPSFISEIPYQAPLQKQLQNFEKLLEPAIVPLNLPKSKFFDNYREIEKPLYEPPQISSRQTPDSKHVKYNSAEDEISEAIELLQSGLDTIEAISRLFTLSKKYPVNMLDKSSLTIWEPNFTKLLLVIYSILVPAENVIHY